MAGSGRTGRNKPAAGQRGRGKRAGPEPEAPVSEETGASGAEADPAGPAPTGPGFKHMKSRWLHAWESEKEQAERQERERLAALKAEQEAAEQRAEEQRRAEEAAAAALRRKQEEEEAVERQAEQDRQQAERAQREAEQAAQAEAERQAAAERKRQEEATMEAQFRAAQHAEAESRKTQHAKVDTKPPGPADASQHSSQRPAKRQKTPPGPAAQAKPSRVKPQAGERGPEGQAVPAARAKTPPSGSAMTVAAGGKRKADQSGVAASLDATAKKEAKRAKLHAEAPASSAAGKVVSGQPGEAVAPAQQVPGARSSSNTAPKQRPAKLKPKAGVIMLSDAAKKVLRQQDVVKPLAAPAAGTNRRTAQGPSKPGPSATENGSKPMAKPRLSPAADRPVKQPSQLDAKVAKTASAAPQQGRTAREASPPAQQPKQAAKADRITVTTPHDAASKPASQPAASQRHGAARDTQGAAAPPPASRSAAAASVEDQPVPDVHPVKPEPELQATPEPPSAAALLPDKAEAKPQATGILQEPASSLLAASQKIKQAKGEHAPEPAGPVIPVELLPHRGNSRKLLAELPLSQYSTYRALSSKIQAAASESAPEGSAMQLLYLDHEGDLLLLRPEQSFDSFLSSVRQVYVQCIH